MGNGTLPCLHTMIKKSSALPQVPKVPWTLGKHVPHILWRWRTNSVVGVHTWLSAVACWLAQLSQLSSTFAPLQACSDQEKWVQSHPSGGWTTRASTGARPLVPVGLRRYQTAKHFHHPDQSRKKRKRKMTPILPPTWIMVLLHFQVGPSVYAIPKPALQELESPRQPLPPFKGERLERARTSWLAPIYPGSHMVNWEYPVHPDTPLWSGGSEVIECNRKSVMKVTHPSTIPALGGLAFEFPWDPG